MSRIILTGDRPTTGIGLALCGIRKSYPVIIVMPENMSDERKKIIRALGAELVLTDPELSIGGAVDKANEIVASDPTVFHATAIYKSC